MHLCLEPWHVDKIPCFVNKVFGQCKQAERTILGRTTEASKCQAKKPKNDDITKIVNLPSSVDKSQFLSIEGIVRVPTRNFTTSLVQSAMEQQMHLEMHNFGATTALHLQSWNSKLKSQINQCKSNIQAFFNLEMAGELTTYKQLSRTRSKYSQQKKQNRRLQVWELMQAGKDRQPSYQRQHR